MALFDLALIYCRTWIYWGRYQIVLPDRIDGVEVVEISCLLLGHSMRLLDLSVDVEFVLFANCFSVHNFEFESLEKKELVFIFGVNSCDVLQVEHLFADGLFAIFLALDLPQIERTEHLPGVVFGIQF